MAQRGIHYHEQIRDRAFLRTPEYTDACGSPKNAGWKSAPARPEYNEYRLYDLAADPFQHVNLVGGVETRQIVARLRERLLAWIEESSGVKPQIDPALFT